MIPETLHVLRPWWFLALVPAAFMTWHLLRRSGSSGSQDWARFVDPHLLRSLVVQGPPATQMRWTAAVFAASLLALVVALAGPTWRQVPVPAYEGGIPRVVVLSLAQSMNTTDVTPSRLTRAVHKLRDILRRDPGEDTGLVIYSDRPFVAAPLTGDGQVIAEMLPELSTSLMPVLGNRPDLAIDTARELLVKAGAKTGRIILLADDAGTDPDRTRDAAARARSEGYTVGILAIGTTDGGTLQTDSGRAIAGADGAEVTVRLDATALASVAAAGGGKVAPLSPGDSDLDVLLPAASAGSGAVGSQSDINSDAWEDAGYWLLLIPLFLAPLAFRRGLLMSVAIVIAGFAAEPQSARAGTWDDLWQTPDQQGKTAFEAGKFDDAANTFEQPTWRAASAYRAGNFDVAARELSASTDDASDYNLGNALANQGDLEAAIAAYDRVLAANPDDADAQFNRDLIAKLLEEQQQQQQRQEEQKQQSQSDDSQQSDNASGDQSDQSDHQNAGDKPNDQQDGSEGQEASGKNGSPAQQAGQDQNPENQTTDTGSKSDGTTPGSESDPSQSATASEHETASGEPASDKDPAEADTAQSDTDNETDKGTLSRMIDRLLSGNGTGEATEPQEEPPTAEAASNAPTLSQTAEQQLRRVPDDPTGLLRARIHQHYNQLRAAARRE